jgi:hypothetical protein
MKVKPTTRLGYMKGLRRDSIPFETPLATNESKLATGQEIGVQGYADVRSSGPRSGLRRFAGDVFPLGLLEPGYVPEPYVPEFLVRDFDFSLSDESDF